MWGSNVKIRKKNGGLRVSLQDKKLYFTVKSVFDLIACIFDFSHFDF